MNRLSGGMVQRDIPIIMSAPMVTALIAGRKTQTRRILGRLRRFGPISEFGRSDTRGYDWHLRDRGMRWHDLRDADLLAALPYAAGDRLWVRETWQAAMSEDGPCICFRADSHRWSPEWTGPDEGLGSSYDYDRYPADYSAWAADVERSGPWASPLHMPRWASRLSLLVTDVRVQSLQEISHEDAFEEGMRFTLERVAGGGKRSGWGVEGLVRGEDPRHGYRLLWNNLHGDEGWNANPWVVALTFTVEHRNIDALPVAA